MVTRQSLLEGLLKERGQIEPSQRQDSTTEQRLRRAQQIAQVGNFELAADGSPTHWSEECFRIIGLEPESELPDREYYIEHVIYPEDREFSQQTIRQALSECAGFSYEYRVLHPDGSIRWVHSRGEPICDEAGKLVSIEGTLLDITEWKLAADATSQLNIALSNAVPGISRLDTAGRYDEVNEFYAGSLGYQPHELIGHDWSSTVHPDDMFDAVQAYEAMRRDGKAEFEARAVRKDGSQFHKRVLMVRIDDADGVMTGHHCFMRDITERKQFEQELRLSAEVMENMAEGVCLVRASDGCLVFTNSRFEELFGYDPGELIDQHTGVLNAPGEVASNETAEKISRAIEETGFWSGEIHNIRKDKTPFWTHSSVSTFEHSQHGTVRVGVVEDITERKQAEKALHESEAQFRILFDNAPDAIFLLRDGLWTDCNQAALSMLGGSREQIVGHGPIEFSPELQPDGTPSDVKVIAIIQAAMENGSKQFEWVHRRLDGTEFFAEISAVAMTIHEQRTLFATVRDITERKLAEEVAREKQAQLDGVLENVDAIILEGDPLEFHYVGGQVEKILGYPKEMWTEHPDGPGGFWFEILHVDHADKPEFCRQAIERGEDHSFEYRLIAKDGTPVWFYDSVSVETRDGKPVKSRAVMIDITERKQAEDEIRQSEENYRSLMENHLVGIAVVAKDEIVFVNQQMCVITGFEVREMIGHAPAEFLVPNDKATASSRIESLMEGSPEYHSEYQSVRKNGTTVPLEVASRSIQYQGKPALLSVITDIGERIQSEEEARKHRDEQAHVSRVSTMEEMATGLAHELNQPLSAIALYSQLAGSIVERPNFESGELKDIVGKLEAQAMRAGHIVRRLRNFLRKTDSTRVSIDLNIVIADVAKFVDPVVRQAEITLDLDFDRQTLYGHVDEIQIQQVLVNLIKNAVDAMAETPPNLRRVKVSSRLLEDGRLEVAVQDSGEGLPDDELQQAFNAFFTTKQEGLGMGLPISRSIIEEHGGKL